MALQIPDLDTIHARLVADYQARLPDMDVSRHSDNYKRLRTVALAALALYYTARVIYDDLFPDTASGAALDRLGDIWGVTRKGATPATKADALRVTGTAASALTTGDELVHASGLRFQVNESTVIPAGGSVDVDVLAIDTGSQTRLNAGETLTFSSPPAGVDAVAELQLDLDEGGADQESDGAYRTRILNRIAQPGMGGNANDYAQWALEVEGVAEAYVYPVRAGNGSVDLAALKDATGTARILNSTERAALQAYIDDLRPVSVKAFRVLEVTTSEIDCDVQVEARPGSQYAWDWDDTGGPLEVAAWTAGTRTLQFTTDRPGDMEAGDRIVIKTAAGDGDGAPIRIEALGAGSDDVILREEDVPAVAPVAGDDVYAGGELTAPVREAILDHYKSLGPAVGDYGTGEWDSDVNPRRLESVALAVEGVRNATTAAPASTQTATDPAFPADDTIELLIPGEVVVRRL